jgi:hypothetical protein
LKSAFKHNLNEISGQLLSKGLITSDQDCQLRNEVRPKSNRAAELVDLVLSKVELDSGSYHTFIECLEEDQENNQQILEILKGAYATSKCEFHCMRRKVDSVFFKDEV